MKPPNEVFNIARNLGAQLANGLPPAQARLYSQFTRKKNNQPGLLTWKKSEAYQRLNDALHLIEISFLKKESNDEDWNNPMLRAAEILEWLMNLEPAQDGLPILPLSAAAYQVAGYPARSRGLIKHWRQKESYSQLIIDLVNSDFQSMYIHLVTTWENGFNYSYQSDNDSNLEDATHYWIVRELISCFGVICAWLRWGEDNRIEIATKKVRAIAQLLNYESDALIWLLAKLCSHVAFENISTSLRINLNNLKESLNSDGKKIIEKYIRNSFINGRTQVWPSQIRGIHRLINEQSFALCTPTGSGKTLIAELAILKGLFSNQDSFDDMLAPIALYMVPSRALAAEVETRLSHVIEKIIPKKVVVTGLYGGTDWGPTDAWLTSDDPTILICTYEKAEALMRFIGPLFLSRLSTVVIDEAHNIQYDGNHQNLITGESRALRLESLGARLFSYIAEKHCNIIALSAVSSGGESTLAAWVSGNNEANPESVAYRSTRQLIGRLECLPDGNFEIRYDLLDNKKLTFTEYNRKDSPFIRNPFPMVQLWSGWENDGPEVKLRPFLFWAAIHLAGIDNNGQQRSVLISLTQDPGGYAQCLLDLLESKWNKINIPVFFIPPNDPVKKYIWMNCLKVCLDYFGENSREYRLLQKGIVIHHGKMPRSLARWLVQCIQEQIVHLVLATSTLSEGINLPFEVVIISNLRRVKDYLNEREFCNLAGRAGRPGTSTEGQVLVLLNGDTRNRLDKARQHYNTLIENISIKTELKKQEEKTFSPLAELLLILQNKWREIYPMNTKEDFIKWLENTAPLEVTTKSAENEAVDVLDTLDSILLSTLVELENLQGKIDPNEFTNQLQNIWNRTYARFAAKTERNIEKYFTIRGTALQQTIYPDAVQRKRLYCTSLPPRQGIQLLEIFSEIKQHLETGAKYAWLAPKDRFKYIETLASLINNVGRFKYSPKAGKQKVAWQNILQWWLDPKNSPVKPTDKQISNWHSYIATNFEYRFNWGLGSVLALIYNENTDGEIDIPSLEKWPNTGLPWAAFWVKELIIWGTLDPVAAFLLGRGIEITRKEAELRAQTYYQAYVKLEDPLNAVNIRNWALTMLEDSTTKLNKDNIPEFIEVKLIKGLSKMEVSRFWRVIPMKVDSMLIWFDPAGYPLAKSDIPFDIGQNQLVNYDFILDIQERTIRTETYM